LRAARSVPYVKLFYPQVVNNFLKKSLDLLAKMGYIIYMKARKNRDGFMGSASREHRVKKGKGSFRRKKKHQQKPI